MELIESKRMLFVKWVKTLIQNKEKFFMEKDFLLVFCFYQQRKAKPN